MKAKDFRQEQDYPYNHFTKLTSTGISPDYTNIEEFAEAYHESKVKTLGLFSVSPSTLLSDNEEFQKQVLNLWGFTKDGGVDAVNQLKIFRLLEWLKENQY